MKKFRFALLALAVSAITFAFTPSSYEREKAPLTTYYAFNMSGTYLGSNSSLAALKASFCPGANVINCAQIWTGKDALNRPTGDLILIIKGPQ